MDQAGRGLNEGEGRAMAQGLAGLDSSPVTSPGSGVFSLQLECPIVS